MKGWVWADRLIYCLFSIMIHFIDQIEVSINERLDHLATLLIDSEQLSVLVKDQDKRRNIVKNFRVIKSAEKIRVANEQRFLKQMEKASTVLSKAEVIACESMLANCMNQYLNSDYEVRKTGEPNDLVDIFMFYYACINAKARVCQLTVIKNCGLVTDLNFLHENIMFMLGNMQSSLNYVYESEKNKFFALTKNEIKMISPEKKEEQQEQKFDSTGRLTISNKSKKKVQQYCFDLSKLLDLEGIYLNYYYFNPIDSQKRKKTLVSNFLKRNVHIKRIMSSYENQYRVYKQKHKK